MSGLNNLPGGSETILIVDDQEAIWDFLIEALQELGYNVVLAENGLDAIEIYASNPDMIDLVLLDMIMPKAGGQCPGAQLKRFSSSSLSMDSGSFSSFFSPAAMSLEMLMRSRTAFLMDVGVIPFASLYAC